MVEAKIFNGIDDANTIKYVVPNKIYIFADKQYIYGEQI